MHQSFGDAIAVALVVGVLATGSSPAIAVAVTGDLGGDQAPGPLARTMLTVSVLLDLAVAVLFIVVLVIGKVTASAGAVNLALAGAGTVRLLGSVAAGAAIALALAQYLRTIRRDTPLFVVVAAFVMAAVARVSGLEIVLIGLVAGFMIENFSTPESARVRGELRRGSVSINAVFFTLAGAGLRLQVLGELWPWVLLIIGLRAWSLRVGLRWAGRDPAVPAEVIRYGWTGLVSQAGVVLGLAQMARRAFPEWGVSLEALIVAMIGVHAVAGPIWFQRALAHVGEVPKGEYVAT